MSALFYFTWNVNTVLLVVYVVVLKAHDHQFIIVSSTLSLVRRLVAFAAICVIIIIVIINLFLSTISL